MELVDFAIVGASAAVERGRRRGCLGIAQALLVVALGAVFFLAGSKTKLIRSTITPGMSVEDVVERAGGWLICTAIYAEPRDKGIVTFQVRATGYRLPGSEVEPTFETRREMARALAAEMAQRHVEWRLTFGYITMTPRRIYFDVEFSSDGRVMNVSETRWGTLD